ncbi:MAG: redoxin family protein [Flavobacteriales bacterium]|nr:redoxin family protein [Flavobacteriales bacterium]
MPQPRFHGPLPQPGTTAPTLRYVKQDRTEGSLAELNGHVVVLLTFPSMDTSTCALETRTFNKLATGLGAKVLAVTMDLPFAMKRFCAAEGIENVEAVVISVTAIWPTSGAQPLPKGIWPASPGASPG